MEVSPSAPPIETKPQILYPTSFIDFDGISDKLSKTRMIYIENGIKRIDFKDKKYRKIEKKLKILERLIKYSSYGMGISLEVVAVLIQLVLPLVSTPISLSIGASGLAIPLLCESLIEALSIERAKFKKKSTEAHEVLLKLYRFTEKALKDKIISDEELQEYEQIINGYDEKETETSEDKEIQRLLDDKSNKISQKWLKKLKLAELSPPYSRT